jgi:AcrR family transcriptional regulator
MQAATDKVRKRRQRDPEATREIILAAARKLLAEDGPEGISLSAVTHLAGVNRGTAYQHFETREKLIAATIASVSNILLQAVYGDVAEVQSKNIEDLDQVALTERLTEFAVSNPDLCRVWLLQVLASDDPSSDPFWQLYSSSLERFTKTELAQPGIDTEVLAVVILAGTFLWPNWARSGAQSGEQRKTLSDRLTREVLRLSMYGSLVSERLPNVADRLKN